MSDKSKDSTSRLIIQRDTIIGMAFEKELIDLGFIKRGSKHSLEFPFINKSSIPIEIAIISSCDCTRPEWAVGKVYEPGEKGIIKATFDSTEKEESEVVDVDIILEQADPKTKYPKVITVQFKYEFIK